MIKVGDTYRPQGGMRSYTVTKAFMTYQLEGEYQGYLATEQELVRDFVKVVDGAAL